MSGPTREHHHDDMGPTIRSARDAATRFSGDGKTSYARGGHPGASGEKALAEVTGVDSYDDLGDVIKAGITLKEWMWLSDGEKARYVQNVLEPEAFDDGT